MIQSWTILLLATVLAGSTPDNGNPQPIPRAADSTTAFALDLYKELAVDGADGNLFFSPLSISTAIGMLYPGARGETAAQMSRVMRFDPDTASHLRFFRSLVETLPLTTATDTMATDTVSVEVHMANRVWIPVGRELRAEYLSAVESSFFAPVTPLDFGNSSAAAAKINAWVSEQTRQRINNLVSDRMLGSMTSIVLTNAIYFKAPWLYEFPEKGTVPDVFTTMSAESVEVPFMRLLKKLPYAELDQAQILQLPYRDSRFSMVIVLPRSSVSVTDIEAALEPGSVRTWLDSLRPAEVAASVPKFKFEHSLSLIQVFERLGMHLPFSDRADFSGISKDALSVTGVVHKAFVEVSEEGTEAAAATAVVIGIDSTSNEPPKPIVFKADRPFLFLIYDSESDTILFIGRMANPPV